MSTTPTSALTFRDLILEVAIKMGVAFYGEDGDEPAQVPQEDHDLDECKRHVNNALRMLISDAPVSGYRWTRPTAQVTLWPTVSVDATRTVTGGAYDPVNDQTVLTANSSVFYESMEEHEIVVTGQGTFTIKQFVSETQVYVYGSHGFASASTYSITADGNYTLPRNFAGTYDGSLTFGAATNRAVTMVWSSEAQVRQWRENTTINTGYPRLIAIRLKSNPHVRRRFEMMAYPTPDSVFVAEFPFDIHFDNMDSLTEYPPTPLVLDEAVRAACLAIVERDKDNVVDGPYLTYYRSTALPAAHQADARSSPRKLGYFGNPSADFPGGRNFREYMKRPNVQFNP